MLLYSMQPHGLAHYRKTSYCTLCCVPVGASVGILCATAHSRVLFKFVKCPTGNCASIKKLINLKKFGEPVYNSAECRFATEYCGRVKNVLYSQVLQRL